VVPARHAARIGGVETAGTGEPAQHSSAHVLLHGGQILWCERSRLGELDLPCAPAANTASITRQ